MTRLVLLLLFTLRAAEVRISPTEPQQEPGYVYLLLDLIVTPREPSYFNWIFGS